MPLMENEEMFYLIVYAFIFSVVVIYLAAILFISGLEFEDIPDYRTTEEDEIYFRMMRRKKEEENNE